MTLRHALMLIVSASLLQTGCNESGAEPIATEQGETTPTVGGAVSSDDRVDPILRSVAEFYRSKQAFAVDVLAHVPSPTGVEDLAMPIAVRRPNLVSMTFADSISIVSDGNESFIALADRMVYMRQPAPEAIADVTRNVFPTGLLGPIDAVVWSLADDDPRAAWLNGVEAMQFVGTEALDEEQTHHIRFTQELFDWDMWVSAGDDPRIVRLMYDLSKAIRAQGREPEGNLAMVVELRDWRWDDDVPADHFAFEPGDYKEVANAFAPPNPLEELVDKEAPAMEVTNLAGDTLEVGGEDVGGIVLLDFWATWCGPCIEELPILIDVASKYADRGVSLIAVNVGEDPATVQNFLDENGLDLNVVLDPEGQSVSKYHAQSIPQLVIIDADGTVRNVHIGYNPEIGTVIGAEIEALLAE